MAHIVSGSAATTLTLAIRRQITWRLAIRQVPDHRPTFPARQGLDRMDRTVRRRPAALARTTDEMTV
jgi:hypothetical protein